MDETEARKKRKEQESKWHVDGVRAMGKKVRTRRKRKEFISLSLSVPKELHERLTKRSKKIGCSMSSLVKTYIYNGLHGVGGTSSAVRHTGKQVPKFTPKINKQPTNYQAPGYFKELKEVLERRKKRR